MTNEALNLRLAQCLEDLIAEMAQCPNCREQMKGPQPATTSFARRLTNARAALSEVKRVTLDNPS